MNLVSYIYRFLQEKENQVKVPNFGVFSFEKKHAVVDTTAHKILPPSEIISFRWDENVNHHSLAEFISKEIDGEVSFIQTMIENEVKNWKKTLYEYKKLHLESLGEIKLKEAEIIFEQENKHCADFFGLEEIALEEIKPTHAEDYTLRKSILWGFLIIAPLIALFYLGIEHQEILLGKKSFENTGRIKETPKIVPKKDSISTDSTKMEQDSATTKSIIK